LRQKCSGSRIGDIADPWRFSRRLHGLSARSVHGAVEICQWAPGISVYRVQRKSGVQSLVCKEVGSSIARLQKRKAAREGGSPCAMSQRKTLILARPAIGHEADAREAEQHHCPCRFGDCPQRQSNNAVIWIAQFEARWSELRVVQNRSKHLPACGLSFRRTPPAAKGHSGWMAQS